MKICHFVRALLSILVVTLVTSCVTETTGRIESAANPKEAAELNVQLGIGYLRQGDWQTAQVKLERALELDSKNIVAHRALGIVYQNLGDEDAAERHYRKAVSLQPKDPDALDGLAVYLCRDESSRDEALELFDRALAVPLSSTFSNKAMLYTNAGICMKRVDLARAEDFLRAALVADPQYAEALLQVADVSYQRDNYLQSRAFLQRHLAIAAPSPGALWLGARIETALGDFRAADNFGNELRKTFPESVETRQLLEQLRDAG
jgi:type IV pilus assembly protein PilF